MANDSCFGWSQRWEIPYKVMERTQGRSRRREEADRFPISPIPPPYLGGYG